jgi:hypothetical protein
MNPDNLLTEIPFQNQRRKQCGGRHRWKSLEFGDYLRYCRSITVCMMFYFGINGVNNEDGGGIGKLFIFKIGYEID